MSLATSWQCATSKRHLIYGQWNCVQAQRWSGGERGESVCRRLQQKLWWLWGVPHPSAEHAMYNVNLYLPKGAGSRHSLLSLPFTPSCSTSRFNLLTRQMRPSYAWRFYERVRRVRQTAGRANKQKIHWPLLLLSLDLMPFPASRAMASQSWAELNRARHAIIFIGPSGFSTNTHTHTDTREKAPWQPFSHLAGAFVGQTCESNCQALPSPPLTLSSKHILCRSSVLYFIRVITARVCPGRTCKLELDFASSALCRFVSSPFHFTSCSCSPNATHSVNRGAEERDGKVAVKRLSKFYNHKSPLPTSSASPENNDAQK